MDILKKIIDSEGSCTQWASKAICEVCPLSKLRQKENGTYLSCIEALGVMDMTEEEADAKYKDVANRLLLDEEIDEILGAQDGPE